MHRIEPCAPYLPRRASDTNKYDYGRVLIVGGCVGYTGAPTLCAHAALRCGAGLVSVGVPEAIYAITAVKNDAAMPFPLPSADGKLTADALPELLERLRRSDVCVLGPGLGRNAALHGAGAGCRFALGDSAGARRRRALCRRARMWRCSSAPRAHRPHAARRGVCPACGCGCGRQGRGGVRFCRCARLHRRAQRAGDGLRVPGRGRAVLRAGNPGMAKGGSGDVLAGMLGALLCQMPARDAVETAVCWHGAGRRRVRPHAWANMP